jgi:hypothetical protein
MVVVSRFWLTFMARSFLLHLGMNMAVQATTPQCSVPAASVPLATAPPLTPTKEILAENLT